MRIGSIINEGRIIFNEAKEKVIIVIKYCYGY